MRVMIWFSTRATRSLYAVSAVTEISWPFATVSAYRQIQVGTGRTSCDIKDADALDELVRALDFFLHVHPARFDAERAEPLRRRGHDRQLLVLLPPLTQVPHALLQLRMRAHHLDRDKRLRALARHLARDGREILHAVVPHPEGLRCRRECMLHGLVRRVREPVRREHAQELLIEVARDGVDERERAPDRVRREPELAV
jgi:hypothetical protein